MLEEALSYVSPPDNELLYRSRDGDVLKLNVDTADRTVVVPNQLFVSIVSPVCPLCGCRVAAAPLCLIPTRNDPELPSTRCPRTSSTSCLRST